MLSSSRLRFPPQTDEEEPPEPPPPVAAPASDANTASPFHSAAGGASSAAAPLLEEYRASVGSSAEYRRASGHFCRVANCKGDCAHSASIPLLDQAHSGLWHPLRPPCFWTAPAVNCVALEWHLTPRTCPLLLLLLKGCLSRPSRRSRRTRASGRGHGPPCSGP